MWRPYAPRLIMDFWWPLLVLVYIIRLEPKVWECSPKGRKQVTAWLSSYRGWLRSSKSLIEERLNTTRMKRIREKTIHFFSLMRLLLNYETQRLVPFIAFSLSKVRARRVVRYEEPSAARSTGPRSGVTPSAAWETRRAALSESQSRADKDHWTWVYTLQHQ